MMLNKTILSTEGKLVNLDLIPSDFIELPHGKLRGELKLEHGQNYGLVGANGVGKSSLLRWSKRHLFGSIAYLDQGPLQPLVNLKVNELLRLAQLELGAKTDELVSYFSFDSLLKRKVNELSGGENQVLKIILTLSLERDWYFLDEPFLNLSEVNRDKVIQKVKEFQSQRKSFLIIEHHQVLLERLVEKFFEIKAEGDVYYVR